MHAFGTRAAGHERSLEDFTGHDLTIEGYQGVHDMNARQYIPGLGMFGGVDPLASSFPSYTPYHYVHGNPVNLIDPTGMSAEIVNDLSLQGDVKNTGSFNDMLSNKESCCPDGGDGDWEDMKQDIRQMGRGSVGRFIDAFSALVATGSGDSQTSGIEQLASMTLPGNGEGFGTDAEKGSDKLIEVSPRDFPGGGGTGVNPVSRVGGTLNKIMPHTVEKKDTVFIRNYVACGECKTDTIVKPR